MTGLYPDISYALSCRKDTWQYKRSLSSINNSWYRTRALFVELL